jgi:hypothetical protein
MDDGGLAIGVPNCLRNCRPGTRDYFANRRVTKPAELLCNCTGNDFGSSVNFTGPRNSAIEYTVAESCNALTSANRYNDRTS